MSNSISIIRWRILRHEAK